LLKFHFSKDLIKKKVDEKIIFYFSFYFSGNSLGSSDRSMAGLLRTPAAVVRAMNQDTLEMLEYPFITMQHYPSGFILHIGKFIAYF
jgi:hypothetical protein